MFACWYFWDHTLCFIHKLPPVSESESLSALSYYHLWTSLPLHLHNGISSMLSWMLWESSVITFVKDLGHKWCSRNVVPYFVNPPFEEERDGFCFNSFLPLFPFPAPVLWTLVSFHLHAYFLSQGQPVTSGGTQASHCKPDVFSPAVKQEAAQNSRLFLAGSDILLWSSRTPRLEDDMTLHLHLWRLYRLNPVQARGCLLPGSARKVSTVSLYTMLLLFFVVFNLSTFKWPSIAHLKGEEKICTI